VGEDLRNQKAVLPNKAIFHWLSKVNYRKHHQSALEGMLEGSAYWFLSKYEYWCWENFIHSSVLWLHGIPGSGKTKIIATVIERLTKLHANVNTTLLAFFYCARNTDEKEHAQPDVVLRSILKQLCCTELDVPISQDVVDANLAKFTDAEKIGCDLFPLSLEETTNLIIKLSDKKPAIIVLDALDECNNEYRQKLLVALDCIIRKSKKSVRILVLS
jgi:hypothetical protein